MTDLTLPVRLDPHSAPDETLHVTAGGLPVLIYNINAGGDRPIHGAFFEGGRWFPCTWTVNGSHGSTKSASALDLRDRVHVKRGVWVVLMQGNGEQFYYDAASRGDLTEKAKLWGFRILRVGYLEDCTDATSADPPLWVDWARLPEWAKWAAADEDGEVWGFDKKPEEGQASWFVGANYRCAEISSSLYRLAPGFDWRETLMQRPEDV